MIYEELPHPHKSIRYEVNEIGCWVCTSHVPNNSGYPCVMRGTFYGTLHKYVYEREVGKVPDGLLIRHKCDNKLCFNPAHLHPGTSQDNRNDCTGKMRHTHGTGVHTAKLSESDVVAIRLSNMRVKDLATMYCVSDTTISRIRTGKLWSHVKGGL